jgi:hypothetical protein
MPFKREEEMTSFSILSVQDFLMLLRLLLPLLHNSATIIAPRLATFCSVPAQHLQQRYHQHVLLLVAIALD